MKRLITCTLLILIAFHSRAQHTRITGSFQNTPLKDFLTQVEKVTDYFFYYDEKDVDSLFISVTADREPLDAVLKKAFTGTPLQFAVDRQHNVFITRHVAIVTTLQPGYFSSREAKPAVPLHLAAQQQLKSNTTASSENRLYEIGAKRNITQREKKILSGYIRNGKTGEPVVNASIYLDQSNSGSTTDQYGYYSFPLTTGTQIIHVQAIGMRDAKFNLVVYDEGKFDIELKEQVQTLKEVVISAQKTSNIRRVQLGLERINIARIKTVPTVFGEADVLRVITTLPGVKTVGEASTGFNVRGGSADQNLILFNEATVYNPTHFFGMFSAFNPEVVKEIELYKSSIPARYGGRLSSVLDISMREGNKKNFTGSAGIGLITTRVNLEGPITKDRTSLIVGARSTYANWLMQYLPEPYKQAKAGFYDGNVSIHHRSDAKNDLYLTGYGSHDRFNLAGDTTYQYNNANANVKWRHTFGSKLTSTFVGGVDNYRFKIFSDHNKVNAYNLAFSIRQLHFKSDFNYLLNGNHSLGFGLSSVLYKLRPGSFTPRGSESLVQKDIVAAEQAVESAVWLTDQYTITNNLIVNGGIRFSLFNNLGPKEMNIYAPGLPKDEQAVTGKKNYNPGEITKTYHSPEYRLSLRYAVSNTFSVKAGYNSLMQYIHVLSNTTAIAPTDIWKLSDGNIKPQKGDQFSFGMYKNLRSNTIETSVELYYKRIQDYLDYKPAATLVLNHHIETDVMNTRGKGYGVELMVKRPVGKFNGWISYTWSRILLKMDDPTAGFPVNRGEYYPANYDKPHDVTMVGNYKANHRFSVSWNVNYSTGRPITLPIGRFDYAGAQRVLYSDRNAYRIPDYFRTDLALNIDGNHKVKQKTHNSWTIGVYNISGRRNPYSVYYVSENGLVNGYRVSVFGNIIPFINYNIRF